MDVHYSKELSHAFVVSPDELKKLVELLQKRIGKVEISADCADDLSREFRALKDLIAYENPKSKEVLCISLRARSDDYSKSAAVIFRRYSWLGSGISIDANGREDVISRLKEEILGIVTGLRPWYNTLPRIIVNAAKFLFIILWFAFMLLASLNIAVMLKWLPVSETQKDAINFLVSLRYVVLIFRPYL